MLPILSARPQLHPLCSVSCQLAAVLASQARQLAVLAWGRNVEGQCGVEGDVPVVARPLLILELHGAAVSSIHAGTLNSAAVLNEEVYTWGDGSSGKLGHGNGDNVTSPGRVEAFIERSAISTAALGQHHSLFLDADGKVWACGENKEGQCGLGLPLEVLASKYRAAYYESLRPAAYFAKQQLSNDRFAQYLRAAVSNSATTAAAASTQYVAQGWGTLSGGSRTSSRSQQQQLSQLFDLPKQRSRVAAAAGFDVQGRSSGSSNGVSYGLAGDLFRSGSSSSGAGGISSSGVWGGADLDMLLHSSRLHAGQWGVPARVASEQPAFARSQLGDVVSSSLCSSDSAADYDGNLEGQRVVAVSASKFFSLAVTDKGEVWAWGADYNGALGSESSWVGSAQRVAGPISEALSAAGGAVAVAAGGTFSAALTAAGTVLVWGKVGGGPVTGGFSAGAASFTAAADSSTNSNSSSRMFAQVQLPEGVQICSISAGQQHLLLSDGQRVWVIGRWLNAAGEEAGVASWDRPHQIFDCQLQSSTASSSRSTSSSPVSSLSSSAAAAVDRCQDSTSQGSSCRIAKVVAGMHSSAVVTTNGQLWLWGRLLEEQRGLSILRRFGGEKYAVDVDWSWAGFGGAEPRLVEGLGRVKDVALGGWHAMVLVD